LVTQETNLRHFEFCFEIAFCRRGATMSSVTDILLAVGYPDVSQIDEINALLGLVGDRGFAPSNHETMPTSRIAGGKGFTESVYVAGINYFNLDDFIAGLRAMQFEQPECLQLILIGEHDARFRLINVFDQP